MRKKNTVDPLEKKRLIKLTEYERAAYKSGKTHVAGVDEAGRGPLAGPVVAAACIIPSGLLLEGVNDSKLIAPKKRAELFHRYIQIPEIKYSVGIVPAEEIDRINIYQATIQAMLQAVSGLSICPELLLVDGLALPHPSIPCTKIIKGDTLSQSIAFASIIAKEMRDQIMRECHAQWPEYGFDSHMGYGTEKHRAAIEKHGPCPIHRYSFEPVKSYCATLPLRRV